MTPWVGVGMLLLETSHGTSHGSSMVLAISRCCPDIQGHFCLKRSHPSLSMGGRGMGSYSGNSVVVVGTVIIVDDFCPVY